MTRPVSVAGFGGNLNFWEVAVRLCHASLYLVPNLPLIIGTSCSPTKALSTAVVFMVNPPVRQEQRLLSKMRYSPDECLAVPIWHAMLASFCICDNCHAQRT